jgi:hypothetical protein
MKKFLSVFAMLALVCMIAIGCTQAEKEATAKTVETVTDVIDAGTKVASAAGVPFAGAVGAAVPFVATTILAFLKMGSQKRKKEALYQSTADLHAKANEIANGLKAKTLSIDAVIQMLPGMVKDVSEISHDASGVYDTIKKDLADMHNKGKGKKLRA